jgi:hypothetical protein
MPSLLRCRCGIDTHAHVIPENCPAYLGSGIPESYRRQRQALSAGVVISHARLPDMPIIYIKPMF